MYVCKHTHQSVSQKNVLEFPHKEYQLDVYRVTTGHKYQDQGL